MATAQKRGFHFPWGGDGRESTGRDGVDPGDLAERLDAATEDLGKGPFGLSLATSPAPPVRTEPATPVEPEPETATEAGAQPDQEPAREGAPDAIASPEAESEEEDPVLEVEAEVEATAPAVHPTADESPGATAGQGGSAWPEADRRTEPAPATAGAAPDRLRPMAAPRRDNPLVAGLVRAMREAARAAREETVAALEAEVATRAEAIRTESTVAITELKKAAEADVAAIKDWSRAEQARVREESEARIVARRNQLVGETEAAGHATEDLLGRLQTTIEAFEAEMAEFFDVFLAEEDPARLAGLAERMPPAPDLETFGAVDAVGATEATEATDEREAVEAEPGPAEAEPGPAEAEPAESAAGESTMVAEPAVAAEIVDEGATETDDQAVEEAAEVAAEVTTPDAATETAEPEAVEPAGADDAESPVGAESVEESAEPDAVDPRTSWLEHLDADAAAAAEAQSLEGLDRQTNVVVSGLASVAGIAGFKAALMHIEGVSAVNVTAGTNGDVLFTVTHAAGTDVREAVQAMAAFDTHLVAEDGATLSLTAREPAA